MVKCADYDSFWTSRVLVGTRVSNEYDDDNDDERTRGRATSWECQPRDLVLTRVNWDIVFIILCILHCVLYFYIYTGYIGTNCTGKNDFDFVKRPSGCSTATTMIMAIKCIFLFKPSSIWFFFSFVKRSHCSVQKNRQVGRVSNCVVHFSVVHFKWRIFRQ